MNRQGGVIHRLLILFLAVLLLEAQGSGRVPFLTFGPGEGLGASWIAALSQAPDGQIWAATDAGLLRFDGRRFIQIPGPALSEDPHQILAQGQGRVWVATSQGLLRHEWSGWSHLGKDQGLPPGPVTCLGLGDHGALWVLAAGRPHVSHDGETFQLPEGWKPGWQATALHAWPGDRILVGDGTQLRVWDPTARNWASLPLPKGLRPRLAVGASQDGQLWCSDRVSAWGWHGTHWNPVPLESGWVIHRQIRGRDGRWWLLTDHGPVGLGMQAEPFVIPGLSDLSSANFRAMLVDQEHNLWLGGIGLQGALGLGSLRVHTAQDGLRGSVWQTLRDSQGRLWVTHRDGLSLQEGGTWRNLLRGLFLSRIIATPDGDLWVVGDAGMSGLHRIRTRTLEVQSIPLPIPGATFGRGLLFHEGELYVASRTQGLFAYAPGPRSWRRVEVPHRAGGSPGIAALARDPAGRLLVGTPDHVLIQQGGVWTPLPGTLGSEALLLIFAPDGALWVGYRGHPRFTRHPRTADGYGLGALLSPLPGHSEMRLYSALFEDDQRLWVGTSAGAFRIHLPTGAHVTLGRSQGLPMDDCDQNGLFRDGDGSLWISTGLGLARLHQPGHLPFEAPPAPFLFEAIQGGHSLPPHPPFSFRNGEGGLELTFGSTSLRHRDRLHLEVRVEGRDANWVRLPGDRLFLVDLPPGLRQVSLRQVTEDGTPSPVLSFTCKVLPAWWQTWWTQLGALVCLVGSIWVAVLLRSRVLERRNAVLEATVAASTASLQAANRELARLSQAKSAFLADMSHELRTPLNAILLATQLVQERAAELSVPELKSDAATILNAGNHLLSLLNGLLDLSKIEAGRMDLHPDVIPLMALLESVASTVEPLARLGGNIFQLHVAEPLPCLVADPTRLRQILLNLAGNAAKFTEKGTLTLHIEARDGGIAFEMRDTGVGMDPAQLDRLFRAYEQGESSRAGRALGSTGLGLTLSRQLAHCMGGTLMATSQPGQGSTFCLWLPASPPGPPAT